MIELRDFRDEDVHDLFRWRCEPEVDRWMYELPPEQFAAHQKWFDAHRADPKRRGWMITMHAAGTAIRPRAGDGSQRARPTETRLRL